MEDRFYTATIEAPGATWKEKVLLNAVLDGHGGQVSSREFFLTRRGTRAMLPG